MESNAIQLIMHGFCMEFHKFCMNSVCVSMDPVQFPRILNELSYVLRGIAWALMDLYQYQWISNIFIDSA